MERDMCVMVLMTPSAVAHDSSTVVAIVGVAVCSPIAALFS